jgi:hypothetical protein
MLTRHMRSKHRREYEAMLKEEAFKKIDSNFNCPSISTQDSTDKLQSSIENFVEFGPTFEKKLLAWIIETYQPLHVSEYPSFREMCCSLSLKAPTIGVHKLQSLGSSIDEGQAKVHVGGSQHQHHNRCLDILQ